MLHTFSSIIVNDSSHVDSSIRTKLERILSYFNECKFWLEEDDSIHKSLNYKALDICRSNIEKEKVDIELEDNSNINVNNNNKKK